MATHRIRPRGRDRLLALTRAAPVVATATLAACDESPTSAASTTTTTSSSTPSGGSPPATSTATLGATRFLAFGDSLTAGEVTSPQGGAFAPFVIVPAASYPTQLEGALRSRYPAQGSPITVANAGRAELATAALPRLADLLANARRDAQALLLLTGGEDLLNLGANGVPATAMALNELAREGRRRGLRVFIAMVPPSVAGRQRSLASDAIRAVNDQIIVIARGEGAVLVDLHAALSQDPARYIGSDGWHPTEAGYRRIADEFLAKIVTEYERR